MASTQRSVFLSSLMAEPLTSLYPLFGVILYKSLNATALELALFIMLRPVVAIFSLYYTSHLSKRRDRLKANVVWAGILARLPFFLFPFITSAMQGILCAALYWLFLRGSIPGWMEILKIKLPTVERSRVFSKSSALAYLEGVVLALAFGYLLDKNPDIWRWLFPLGALVGMVGVYYQAKIPLEEKSIYQKEPRNLKQAILRPWKDSYQVLKSNPGFLQFQWGTMVSGFGLMVFQPALPIFFVDTLKISYQDLAIALSVCKGIGFAVSSTWWSKKLHEFHFQSYTGIIYALFGFFPFVLLSSATAFDLIYFAYFIYGIAQAGSHLTWHLSGTLFSEDEESSRYSSVNILAVGIRGAIAPALGALLLKGAGPIPVLFLGGVISLYAFWDAALNPANQKSSKVFQ